jgi:hypothetical protein
MKLVGLSTICLNKMDSKVNITNNLSNNFIVQNGLNQGDALSPLLFSFTSGYAIRKVQERV